MIRWKASQGARTVFGIGLSQANIQRLQKGDPIHFNGEEYGFPGIDFVIHYGKTEQLMYEELQANGMTDRDTIIKAKRDTRH